MTVMFSMCIQRNALASDVHGVPEQPNCEPDTEELRHGRRGIHRSYASSRDSTQRREGLTAERKSLRGQLTIKSQRRLPHHLTNPTQPNPNPTTLTQTPSYLFLDLPPRAEAPTKRKSLSDHPPSPSHQAAAKQRARQDRDHRHPRRSGGTGKQHLTLGPGDSRSSARLEILWLW